MVNVSIVIPTFNRSRKLQKVLDSLFSQNYPPSRYEIVVVDDGSTDDTPQMVASRKEVSTCRLTYLRQEKSGPAAARNLGIGSATGDIVLLLGDDMVAHRELIQQHMKCQAEHEGEVAVLGYITWSPEIRVTPFMRYIGEFGDQFGYHFVDDGEEVSYAFFYGSNLSIRRDTLLEKGLFDQDFKHAAFEDTELGFRLQQKGLRIVFNREAVGYHCHATTLRKYTRRQVVAGLSAAIGYRKHPNGFLTLPGGVHSKNAVKSAAKHIMIPIFALFVNLMDRRDHEFSERRYRQILDYYFLRGFKKGMSRLQER